MPLSVVFFKKLREHQLRKEFKHELKDLKNILNEIKKKTRIVKRTRNK